MLWRYIKQNKNYCHFKCKYGWTKKFKPLFTEKSKNPISLKCTQSFKINYDLKKIYI